MRRLRFERQQYRSQVVGLRYFNVYGPNEQHKVKMKSVVLNCYEQLKSGDTIELFAGTEGFADGEQQRDFIYVEDTVKVKLWFLDHPEISGIFNVGTGLSRSFNDIARLVMQHMGRGQIHYIPLPESAHAHYQSFSQADLSALRSVGYKEHFLSLEEGIQRYLDFLK